MSRVPAGSEVREEFPICGAASDNDGKVRLSWHAHVEDFEGSPVCTVQDDNSAQEPPCMTGGEERSVTASWMVE